MQTTNREKELFEQALELAPDERVATLRAECGSDAGLMQRVLSLLAANDAPDSFLPGLPGGLSGSGLGDEAPGSLVGRYKILERIGEGGFGVVCLAEQVEPLRRRVALKIVKPGMDSKQVIARFEAERQALALMDHPNIARVFDAGMTPHGRPFFVMELVQGVPVTTYCRERNLDLEARLELVIEICSAVQHAHQKGIIHRDLKPANILVAQQAGRPMPKVIDFGIAKAISGEPLSDKTIVTFFRQFLGTPPYMSPEQAAMNGRDVDTRSDIYSLGVLLYELLTGGPPFDGKQLLDSGPDAMRKTILDREPDRPSTRIRKTASLDRSPSIPLRAPAVSKDLDLIVMMALAKDPDRRYATAHELAADLRRFLEHAPVTAVPPTLGYRMARFCRRNRAMVAAGVTLAAVLLASAILGATLAIRAHRAESVSISEAAAAQNVSEYFWKEILKQLAPWHHTNRQVSLREAFELAAANIDTRLGGQPLAEASVRFSFGKTYLGLFEFGPAETNLVRALELRRAQGSQPAERIAEVLYQMGILREFQGRWPEAEQFFEEVALTRSRTLGQDHRDIVTAKAKAALNHSRLLPPGDAEELLTRHLARLRQFVARDHHVTIATMNRLAEIQRLNGRFEEAYETFAESHRLSVSDEGPFCSNALWALDLMASTRAAQRRLQEAEKLYLELIAIREKVNGHDHLFTLSSRMTYAGEVLLPQGRILEAAPILLEAAARGKSDQSSIQPASKNYLEALLAASESEPTSETQSFRLQAKELLE